MREYIIHPLVVGINETDQGVMTYLREYGKRIYLPIYVFYLKGGGKNILVDTGLEQFMIPDRAEEECGFKILEFEDALATVDLKPEDVDIIVHTHLHNDHCENDYKSKRWPIFCCRCMIRQLGGKKQFLKGQKTENRMRKAEGGKGNKETGLRAENRGRKAEGGIKKED